MQLDRDTLKEFFERGDFPTEAQFAHLIDSSPNFIDDSITGTDERVKISATDTLASYLNSKLAEGTGITFAVLNPGADEQLQISATSGGGDVSKVGTPVNNQVGVWTGDGTIEGTTGLTYNGTSLAVTGNITLTGTVDGIDIATDVAANTAKTSNVSTNLSFSRTATTVTVESSDGTNAVLPEANTTNAGILGSDKWDEIVANTAKVTNATHTGDVTGSTALTIAVGAVDLAMLSATGTPSGSNFLRGDNTWEVPGGSGDMVLADVQTVSGAKTFEDTKFLLRNVADTFNGSFVNTNTVDRIYTLQNAAGTLAFTSDITGTNSGTNTGDQTSIVGITGTKAQFDTAVTDGNIMYTGDAPTAHTHLLAAGATDVTATFGELNLLDLAGLTVGWVLSADTATTASWKAPTGGGGGMGVVVATDNYVSTNSLGSLTTGDYNIALGAEAGEAITTTNYGIFLGNRAGYYETAANKLFISSLTAAEQVNEATSRTKSLIYGVQDTTTVNQTLDLNAQVSALYSLSVGTNLGYTSAEGLHFGDGSSRIYQILDGTLAFYTGDGISLYLTSSLLEGASSHQFLINHQTALSATSPSFSFRNATGTGMGHAATNQLSLIANSIEGLRLEEASSHVIQKVEDHTGITANATQTQGQTPLLSSYNEISTVATTNDVVTMPTATSGYIIIVFNNGANTLQLYPASGDNLGAGVDTSITLTAGSVGKYWAYDATNWIAI